MRQCFACFSSVNLFSLPFIYYSLEGHVCPSYWSSEEYAPLPWGWNIYINFLNSSVWDICLFSTHLFNHYLHQYEFMNIYFILWFIIQHCFIYIFTQINFGRWKHFQLVLVFFWHTHHCEFIVVVVYSSWFLALPELFIHPHFSASEDDTNQSQSITTFFLFPLNLSGGYCR